MPIRSWWERAQVLSGAPRVRGLSVDAADWSRAAEDVAASGGRLLALWACDIGRTPTAMFAAYLSEPGLLVLELPVQSDGGAPGYPSLAPLFPAANRMQRAARDLADLASSDPDQRPWLNHDAPYEFVRVEGEGVHEIAVGPVHAGIIEPGHFRFSVVGEKVLRLEQRLGYVHKGIEARFAELDLMAGQGLAARVSGDCAVAFSWAYCQALEGLAACTIPLRAAYLRALMLELERIANHLGDLGALGNDAGFAFGLAQFSRLKEQLLRALDAAFGQRYLMDALVPGGTAQDLAPGARAQLAECVTVIALEVMQLRVIYTEHAGLRDRFAGTGHLSAELAVRLGVLGLAARASGQPLDLRNDLPCAPYDSLRPHKVVLADGDVAARVALRFDELAESVRLVRDILRALPAGPHRVELGAVASAALGIGLIESWRGPVLIALEAASDGGIRRCHPHDCSWQNWPALEHAILGNIVPDFPLINKSFNLSYSGADL